MFGFLTFGVLDLVPHPCELGGLVLDKSEGVVKGRDPGRDRPVGRICLPWRRLQTTKVVSSISREDSAFSS